MKRFSGIGWLIILLMASLLDGSQRPAQAGSSVYWYLQTCQQVRSYRGNSSDRELLTLEYQYCVLDNSHYSSRRRRNKPIYIPLPPESASQDCIDATILAKLAIAQDPYGNTSSEIAGFQQVLCTLPDLAANQRGNFEWRNGKSAKFGGNWYYPNGESAKFGSSWYYPNGKSATFGSNWYYPNGENASFGSFWYYPDGDSTDLTSLLSWSCSVLSYGDCQDGLADLQTAKGFWYDLTVIELSSRAYQEIEHYRRYDADSNDDININIIVK